jgi:hypothetical protein
MAATTEEAPEMRRRKRFTIKLVALGLALAAISASPAQAKLDEGLGMPRQSEPILVVSPDDRNLDLTPAVQIEPNVIVSPDDRRLSRMSPVAAAQPSLVSSDDGFELGTFGMGGIILLVGAAGTLLALHQTRKGKLASA